jgi:glycosyltransferase involved in cell wall biosynthesis
MKILFEEHAAPQRAGGIEAATQGLAASLAGQGVTVNRRVPESPNSKEGTPDCVHIHGIWSPVLARRFMHWRRKGIPCVVTVHGMLEPWALAHKKLKKQVAWHLYQKRLLNQASALHATSEREAENLKKLGLNVPIAMIPWGIEIPQIRSQKSVDGSQKIGPIQNSKFKIQNSIRTALFVGRLYPVKGLPLLLDAWARIKPSGWVLRLVGPDEAGNRPELEHRVTQLGLSGVVTFTGPLTGEELAEEYRRASVFVLPSHTENFGMAIGEALSHGVPVITTEGAPWKLLEQERCGWWVPVNVDGIAAALNEATNLSPEELASMGSRGRLIVEERFAWDRIAAQFVACYRWIGGNGDKPDSVV